MTQGFDPSGSAVSRSYSDGTNTLFAETVVPLASGQSGGHTRTTVGGATHQGYSYDGVGRLTGVQDQVGDLCSARSYAFDAHSNRTVLLSTTGSPGDVACPALPSTSGVTAQHTFDSGDRLVDSGYLYDAFGRATATPNQLTNTYFVNDLVHSQVAVAGSGSTAVTTTQTWSLEPGGRFGSFTIAARDALGAVVGTDVTKVNHYDDSGDSPTFIEEGDGTITHMFTAPDGDVAMLTNRDGNRRLQLANLHGDIAVQIPEDNAFAFAITVNAPVKEFDADEYGNPRAVGTDVQNVDGTWDLTPVSVRTQPRYGWLGSKQRSTEAQGGVILMGVRLYDPTLGRFLSVDPIYGGNPNPYIYPTDPINAFDLNGKSAGIGPSYQHCYTNCHSYSRSCAWTCMKHWASRTSHHVVVSVGGCAVVCASLSYQGGHLSWGLGGTGFSVPYPAIGYSRLRARKRLNGWYAFGNLFGAYYSHHSNNGYSQRNNYEVGLGKIGWGFAFGGMYSHHLFTAPWAD